MQGLMLHCGAEAVSRQELATVLPKGKLGTKHNPVPFIETVELVTEALQNVGYAINDEGFGVTRNNNRFFGLMEVAPLEGEVLSEKDYSLLLGLRGSYDQTFPRGFVIGSRVFVCDNLAFNGDIRVSTRQTTFINQRLPGMIYSAMNQLVDMAAIQDQLYGRMKEIELTPVQAESTMIKLIRAGAVAPQQLHRLIKEWDEPSHPEHAEYGDSVWRMHNAMTEILKPVGRATGVINIQNRTMRALPVFQDLLEAA